MATQYWVGDFFIDLSRNQITQQMKSQTLPPKALAVLTYLAKNANKVMSTDEILQEVWPDTVVTPNTLQRSIAQLRKALGEDGQSHLYIKTHAKQGYSLECEVRWQNEADVSDAGDDVLVSKAQQRRFHVSTFAIISSVITLAIVFTFFGLNYQDAEEPMQLDIAEIRTLTATDDKEYYGVYSPDGQYVVFQRYSDEFCNQNNIWAKDINTQEEIQLTKNLGAYGSHSFSKDGKELVFIETENCDKPVNQNQCYKLMTLDFQKALRNPQAPNIILECKDTRIRNSKWLNNNDIVFLHELSNRWHLSSYSIDDNTSTILYELPDGSVIDYDYSTNKDLLALNTIQSDGKQSLVILKPDGQVISNHPIELPEEVSEFRFIYPNFTPFDNQLIFSTGRQLFNLTYDGKVSNVSLPVAEPMGSPIFHKNQKRMLVIKGHYDSDIASIQLSDLSLFEMGEKHRVTTDNYTIMERSNQGEDLAQFQPNGDLIAYESERSGDEQIWLTDEISSRQLSNFPVDNFLFEFDWADDGKSLLVNVDKQLIRLYLDGKSETIAFKYPVEELFQWNSRNGTALLKAVIKGVVTFVELDLASYDYQVINNKRINWALRTADGQLVYTDHMNRFWQQGPVEDKLIEALEHQSKNNQRFITRNNIIYGVNNEFQIWSYRLGEDNFEILGNLPRRLDYITDISDSELLLSLRIAAKKEVAELTLAE